MIEERNVPSAVTLLEPSHVYNFQQKVHHSALIYQRNTESLRYLESKLSAGVVAACQRFFTGKKSFHVSFQFEADMAENEVMEYLDEILLAFPIGEGPHYTFGFDFDDDLETEKDDSRKFPVHGIEYVSPFRIHFTEDDPEIIVHWKSPPSTLEPLTHRFKISIRGFGREIISRLVPMEYLQRQRALGTYEFAEPLPPFPPYVGNIGEHLNSLSVEKRDTYLLSLSSSIQHLIDQEAPRHIGPVNTDILDWLAQRAFGFPVKFLNITKCTTISDDHLTYSLSVGKWTSLERIHIPYELDTTVRRCWHDLVFELAGEKRSPV